MTRREFKPKVYAEIVLRATNGAGRVTCEGCGLVLGRRPYHVDHTIPDALQIDKTRELTAADGKLLGVECCHKPKSADDIRAIRKAQRNERKNRLGIRSSKRPMDGSRNSKWRKPFSGPAVLR